MEGPTEPIHGRRGRCGLLDHATTGIYQRSPDPHLTRSVMSTEKRRGGRREPEREDAGAVRGLAHAASSSGWILPSPHARTRADASTCLRPLEGEAAPHSGGGGCRRPPV